jgi:hypothetical protein
MMRYCNLCLILICACGGPVFPPPVRPLVPTPDDHWRNQPPRAAGSTAIEAPTTARSQLTNGMTLLAAEVADAPYADVVVVVAHTVQEGEARKLATALEQSARDDLRQLSVLSVFATSAEIELRWRCEPGHVDDALRAAAAVLTRPLAAGVVEVAERRYRAEEELLGLRTSERVVRTLRARITGVDGASLPVDSPEISERSIPVLFTELIDPAHMALVVAGPIAAQATHELAEQHLGSLAQPVTHARRFETSAAHLPTERAILFIKQHMPVALIGFAFVAPRLTRHRNIDAHVLARVLGYGIGSILNAALRETHGMTYGVHVYYEEGPSTGMLYGLLAVQPARLSDALEQLRNSFERVRRAEQPVQFRHARDQIRAGLILSTRWAELVASHLAQSFIAGRQSDLISEETARLETIKPRDIQILAQRVLHEPQFVVAGSRELLATLQWDGAPVELVR